MAQARFDSEAYDLQDFGTLLRTYRQGPRSLGLIALRMLVLLASVSVVLLCGLSANEGSFAVLSQSPAFWCIAIPVLLILLSTALPKLAKCVAEWGDVAEVYATALAYRHRGVWQMWLWPEVAELTVSKEPPNWFFGDDAALLLMPVVAFLVGHFYRYHLVNQDGEQLTIGETLDHVDELMATIQEQTFATRLSGAMQAFDAGETVGFGALSMDRESGIGSGSNLCPWEEVSSIWIPKTANTLSVTPQQHSASPAIAVRTRDLANVDVLFTLAAQRLGVALESGGRFLSVEAD